MNSTLPIILAFDFYGDGNIGDDLMLAGFLSGLNTLDYPARVAGTSRNGLASRRKRFPAISWHTPQEFAVLGTAEYAEGILAGVGGTPFQMTCGRKWFLDFLLEQKKAFKGLRRVMVNIGAEAEIRSHLDEFKIAVSEYDRISARDEFSAGLAREALGGAADRVRASGDLATLALKQVVFPKGGRTARSIILAGDTLQDQDLVAVAEYLAGAKSTVDFIVNDVSPYDTMEQALYRRVAPRRFFGLARRGTLRIPDYDTADWRELLVPYRSSEVVVSTRYHGLLCSAYSGCRTGAIARSSKVAALASQLKVPFCTPPLTAAKIADVFDNACLVDASILRGMEARALDGIDFCLRS